MRYKIRTQTDSAFQDVLSLVEGKTSVFVTSPKRRLLSTGDLAPTLRTEVEQHGGRVVVDRRYDLERSGRS
jgi:hypothetical protein